MLLKSFETRTETNRKKKRRKWPLDFTLSSATQSGKRKSQPSIVDLTTVREFAQDIIKDLEAAYEQYEAKKDVVDTRRQDTEALIADLKAQLAEAVDEATAETEPNTVKVTPKLITKMVHDSVEGQFADAKAKARIGATDSDAVALLDAAFAAAYARRINNQLNSTKD
jgi:hypothetical protein